MELLSTYRSGVGRAGLEAAVSDLFERETRQESRAVRLTTRMLSAQAVNAGRRDAIERGGIPLRGAQYSAILDRRTCPLCDRLDEQVIAAGDLDLVKFTPPVHHNCRCQLIWITQEEEDFTPTWQSPPRSLVEAHGSLVVG
jgi:SPP1 gp7 family putative phage head morphogenesis protein